MFNTENLFSTSFKVNIYVLRVNIFLLKHKKQVLQMGCMLWFEPESPSWRFYC